MAMVKTCNRNILESAESITLAAGTEDSSYPIYRLYDRHIGLFFKPTLAETIEIKIDQGPSGNLACDRLLIPAGHNLDGMTLDFKYSDDDAAYTPYVSQWVQSGSGLINKSWVSSTRRYKKFIITSPGAVPQIPEIFLTQTYEWERNPSRPTGSLLDKFNVQRIESSGGQVRHLTLGDPREYRSYPRVNAKSAQKVNAVAMYDAWAGAKPFFLSDHDGTWIYGEILNMEMSESASDRFPFSFEFLEVLP